MVHRSWSKFVLAGIVAATAAFVPGVDDGESATCRLTRVEDFAAGLPGGWDVQTGRNDGGTATWHGEDGQISRSGYMRTEASGIGAKDDRLTSATFTPSGDAVVQFHHDWVLGPGAGAVLEISTDDGDTWSQVPADAFTSGGYTGVAAMQPAWTGVRPGHETGVPGAGPMFSSASLAGWAGQDVQLGWRLLQPEASGVPDGGWNLVGVSLRALEDPRCDDQAPASVRCRTTIDHSPTTQLPDGWQVETARNDDGTDTWAAEPYTTPAGFGVLDGGVTTAADGRGAKDDRLIASLVPGPTTVVSFRHAYHLEPDRDGGVIEVSTDGGETWTDAAERLRLDGYDGTIAGGRGAFTGDSYDTTNRTPSLLRLRFTGVWLGDLAGSEVLLRWRLLQDDERLTSVPGRRWQLRSFEFRDVLDPSCLAGGATPTRDGADDIEVPCPGLASTADGLVAASGDDGTDRTLHLRIAYDLEEGVDVARLARDPATAAEAQARFDELVGEWTPRLEPVARTFEPLGIDVEFSHELLDPITADGKVRPRVQTVNELIDRLKQQHDGMPPDGVDVVYGITDSDLTDAVGQADCTGGIAFRETSFAASEAWLEEPAQYFGVGSSYDVTAKIVAHEVSHLLGAHHHLANCTEGVISQPVQESTTTCTVMFSDPPFLSENLSTANAAVVRGYASRHLD